jgi:uncharacterized protein YdhG (YjbR/CyaY superfamily)
MSSKEISARLKSFPKEQSEVLLQLRKDISELLPGAHEEIKYGIPTWTIQGIGVIGIDGFKNHNSLFPYGGDLGAVINVQLAKFERTKGSIHFEINQHFPKALLRKVLVRKIEMINDSFPNSKGKVFEFYSNGFLKAKGSMKSGALHGYWEWYRKEGTIMRSGHFKNGLQTGEWITYDSYGSVYKVTTK